MININTYILEKLKINKNTKIDDYNEKILTFLSQFDYFNYIIKDKYEIKYFSNENGCKWYSFNWSKAKINDDRTSIPEEDFINQVIRKGEVELKNDFEKIVKSSLNSRINFIINYETD